MLARVSTIPTAMKRNRVQDYNGPKAVRDHGRVATRSSAAGDESPQEQSRPIDSDGFDSREADEGTHSCHPLFQQYDLNDAAIVDVRHIPFPVDSGFDLPPDYDHFGSAVSSGEAEITP